jgi:hypothetical protein
MNRREFLQLTAAGGAVLTRSGSVCAAVRAQGDTANGRSTAELFNLAGERLYGVDLDP